MDDQLLHLGVGGMIVVLVIRDLFKFLAAKKNGQPFCSGKDNQPQMLEMQKLVKEIHDWHNVRNVDGQHVWLGNDILKKMADVEKKIDDSHDDIHVIMRGMK